MEALKASTFPLLHRHRHRHPISTRNGRNIFKTPILRIPSSPPTTTILLPKRKSNFKIFTASTVESSPPDQEIESDEKFDWYENWYPVAPVCDLDKRRPHAKKVIGIDVVVWWDRNANAWKVFDDSCPHRLAPLSEGRIDQWGRLQCVYHGWCFGGAGDCKFIPQAPRDGPPIHTSNKACVGVYPTCVQNGIIWFWPSSDPQYKEIYLQKKPPYIPELDDPSYTNSISSRDIPYGYEILVENLMDPAHVPYAHYGILRTVDIPEREGGGPLKISVEKIDVNGCTAKLDSGVNKFVAPCLYYATFSPDGDQSTIETSSDGAKDVAKATVSLRVPPKKKVMIIFYCVPVSPGKSRLMFASPRNFAVWIDRILPRWILHIGENLILDSDLYLLSVEERRLKDIGSLHWLKSCYIPTGADTLVVAFRRWLNKYGGTQVDWRNKDTGTLPPIPPREQLFDRYWSHTVGCSSCSVAYKRFNALEIALQVISISSVAIAAAAKQGCISIAARYSLASMAVLCFVASKLLSHFVYKTFKYHDYDHAFH